MKVIATKLGVYGRYRYPGDTFDVKPGETSKWWKPVEEEPTHNQSKGGSAQADDAPPADDPPPETIENLRAEYLQVFDKQPQPAWKPATLRKKIDAKNAKG